MCAIPEPWTTHKFHQPLIRARGFLTLCYLDQQLPNKEQAKVQLNAEYLEASSPAAQLKIVHFLINRWVFSIHSVNAQCFPRFGALVV